MLTSPPLKRGGRRGKECELASNDWRRGAAGSPDPELVTSRTRDPLASSMHQPPASCVIWSGGIDCFVELAWLAGRVEMASYGVDAIVVPARDPRVLAKQACSLSAVT